MRMPTKKPFWDTARCFEFICGLIAIIGFFLVGGAMGGCDSGALSIGRAVVYCIIGMVMCVAGMLGAAWFSKFDDDDDDDDNEDGGQKK